MKIKGEGKVKLPSRYRGKAEVWLFPYSTPARELNVRETGWASEPVWMDPEYSGKK
jgi:hypothetical protein